MSIIDKVPASSMFHYRRQPYFLDLLGRKGKKFLLNPCHDCSKIKSKWWCVAVWNIYLILVQIFFEDRCICVFCIDFPFLFLKCWTCVKKSIDKLILQNQDPMIKMFDFSQAGACWKLLDFQNELPLQAQDEFNLVANYLINEEYTRDKVCLAWSESS